MKKVIAFFGLVLALLSASPAKAAFGTKFVCCRSEVVSCLGSGSSTIYTIMLRDRAITQLDAYPRCGIYSTHWGTHSCPANVSCPDANVYQPPVQPQAPRGGQITIVNPLDRDVRVGLGDRTSQDAYYSRGWAYIRAGSQTTLNFNGDRACVAVNFEGFDHIGLLDQNGRFSAGTSLGEMWIHRSDNSEVFYGKNGINSNYLSLNLDGKNVGSNTSIRDGEKTRVFNESGITSYRCLVAPPGNNRIVLFQ